MRPTEAPSSMRPPGAGLLRLYPRRWRERYEAEMLDVLRGRRVGLRGRLDLARGAADARLHPPVPSLLPGAAAVVGGLVWAFVGLGVLSQPVPPDWPGYLAESLAPALLAAGLLLVAVTGAWLRSGDEGGRFGVLAIDVAFAGHLAWAIALGTAFAGLAYGPATAIAQTAAAAGTVAVGLVLLRARDERVGVLLLVAGVGLLVPSAWAWLAAGIAWTAVGFRMVLERARRTATGPIPT